MLLLLVGFVCGDIAQGVSGLVKSLEDFNSVEYQQYILKDCMVTKILIYFIKYSYY